MSYTRVHIVVLFGSQGGYIYSRVSNPTVESVESAVNLLEGGAGSLGFGSGMAAISTSLNCFLQAGDHVV